MLIWFSYSFTWLVADLLVGLVLVFVVGSVCLLLVYVGAFEVACLGELLLRCNALHLYTFLEFR